MLKLSKEKEIEIKNKKEELAKSVGAKSIEFENLNFIEPGDMVLVNGKIVTITESDIVKDNFGFIKICGKSMIEKVKF
jgi:hypothetical protein